VNITNWIQAISASVAAIVTIVLARITYIYVRETKRMASAIKAQTDMQEKEFILRMTPRIEDQYSKRIDNVIDPTISIRVKNVGYYPVKFTHIFYNLFNTQSPSDQPGKVIYIERWLDKNEELLRDFQVNFSEIGFANVGELRSRGGVHIQLHFDDINGNQFRPTDKNIFY
jgi:hypothetical protein